MSIIEERLFDLGNHLDFAADEALAHVDLVESVRFRLDSGGQDAGKPHRNWIQYAALVLVLGAAISLALPSSRNVIADWFGLDGVQIRFEDPIRTTASTPADTATTTATPAANPTANPAAGGATAGVGDPTAPRPGPATQVEVNGRTIYISVLAGVIADDALVKTLGPGTNVMEVAVGEHRGLWISGEPHQLAYRSDDDLIVFELIVGNTLVWQNGDTITRLEGFDTVEEAIDYAATLGTND